MATMAEEIRSLVEQLPPDLQRQVLKFAKGLTRPNKDVVSLLRHHFHQAHLGPLC